MNPFNPFTNEHNLLRQSVQDFIQKEIAPNVDEWEKNKICSPEIFKKMGEHGFFGVTFPEEYSGSGMDLWGGVVVAEELAKSNVGGLSMSLYAHAFLPLPLINAIGTHAQKLQYLQPALEGKKIAALAITEPQAGSDVGGIKTTLTDCGEYFTLNGSKMFITNGTIADFIVVVARSGDGYNMSVVIVDTNLQGFEAVPVTNKLGMHTSDTAQLFFNDCKIPKTALLGEVGNGFYYIMNNLQEERLIASVIGTSSAEAALHRAMNYANDRMVFGRSIDKFQVTRHKFAKMAIDIEACRSIAYRAVHEFIEQGSAAVKIVSMAKAFVSEKTNEIIDNALQIYGGWGYMEDYGIARSWRDARLMTIGAGTTEVMHEIISKMIVDDVKHQKQYVKSR